MKKAVLSAIALMLCLVFLAGCTHDLTTTDQQEIPSTTTTTTTKDTTTTTTKETTSTTTEKSITTESQTKPTLSLQEVLCKVVYVEENAIVVSMPSTDYGYVCVKKDGVGSWIIKNTTLVIKFLESDLQPIRGNFIIRGKEEEYSYVLENPRGIRRADPSKGEPTFG